MIKLTQKTLQYAWCALDEKENYDFTDWDEVTKDWTGQKSNRETRIEMGRPRYQVAFTRVPKGKKREVSVWLYFDDNAEYQGIKTEGKQTKDQVKEWEDEALSWLVKNGFAERGEKQ